MIFAFEWWSLCFCLVMNGASMVTAKEQQVLNADSSSTHAGVPAAGLNHSDEWALIMTMLAKAYQAI